MQAINVSLIIFCTINVFLVLIMAHNIDKRRSKHTNGIVYRSNNSLFFFSRVFTWCFESDFRQIDIGENNYGKL